MKIIKNQYAFRNTTDLIIFFLTEREVDESYREHLVDMTRFFPGFDHNNELTDEGADMLNDIVEF